MADHKHAKVVFNSVPAKNVVDRELKSGGKLPYIDIYLRIKRFDRNRDQTGYWVRIPKSYLTEDTIKNISNAKRADYAHARIKIEIPEGFDANRIGFRERLPEFRNMSPKEIQKKVDRAKAKNEPTNTFSPYVRHDIDTLVDIWENQLATQEFLVKPDLYHSSKADVDKLLEDKHKIPILTYKSCLSINLDDPGKRDLVFRLPIKDEQGAFTGAYAGFSCSGIPYEAVSAYATDDDKMRIYVLDTSKFDKSVKGSSEEKAYPGTIDFCKREGFTRMNEVGRASVGLWQQFFDRAKTQEASPKVTEDLKLTISASEMFGSDNKEMSIDEFNELIDMPDVSVPAVVDDTFELDGFVVSSKTKLGKDASEPLKIDKELAAPLLVDSIVKTMDVHDAVAINILECEELADQYGLKYPKPIDVSALDYLDYSGDADDIEALTAYKQRLVAGVRSLKDLRKDYVDFLIDSGVPGVELPMITTERGVRSESYGSKDMIKAMQLFNSIRGVSVKDSQGHIVMRQFGSQSYQKNVFGRYALSDAECDRLEQGLPVIAANIPDKNGKSGAHYRCTLVKASDGSLDIETLPASVMDKDFMDPAVNESVPYYGEKWERQIRMMSFAGISKYVKQHDAKAKTEPSVKQTHEYNGREALFMTLSMTTGTKNSLKRRQETYDRLRSNPSSPAMKKLGFETEYDERRFLFGNKKLSDRVAEIDHELDVIKGSLSGISVDALNAEKADLTAKLKDYETEKELRSTPAPDKYRSMGYTSLWEVKVHEEFEELSARLGNGEVKFDEKAAKVVWKNQRLQDALFIRQHGFVAYEQRLRSDQDPYRQLGVNIPGTDQIDTEVPDFV